VQNFKLKFQTVAEKTAKNFRVLLFLPHPVETTLSYGRNLKSWSHSIWAMTLAVDADRWLLKAIDQMHGWSQDFRDCPFATFSASLAADLLRELTTAITWSTG